MKVAEKDLEDCARAMVCGTDSLTAEERSKRMALVRAKDTKPELCVRRLVHALGYRYRLHQSDLPGRPDLVFRKRRRVIFVHGCFWHRHNCPMGNRMPKTRVSFWRGKLRGTGDGTPGSGDNSGRAGGRC